MRNVHVDLGSKSYDIVIDRGLLPHVGSRIKTLLPKTEKIAVITDSNVGPLYASLLQESLENAGCFSVAVLTFTAGEASKNLQTLGTLYDGLAAAGTFLRGISFIQIPTSLLATVDSSVGGKVAVDLSGGKNLVGAFYQPKAVFIDPDLLKTLPVRYLHDGLAEVIKYGCIMDKELFMMLEKIQSDEELLTHVDEIIEICCNIKARIVEHDEFDTGERMLLNFGHTLGHAVEKTFHFDRYSHGEGVGIGMVLLTRQSEELGLTERGTADRIAALLQKFQLPIAVDMRRDDFLQAIALDKKKRGSHLTLILLKKIGDSFLQNVSFRELIRYLP